MLSCHVSRWTYTGAVCNGCGFCKACRWFRTFPQYSILGGSAPIASEQQAADASSRTDNVVTVFAFIVNSLGMVR